MKQIIARGTGVLLVMLGVVANSGSASAICFGYCPVWLDSASDFSLPNASIMGIVGNLTFWLLAILGFIGIIGFVIAGILYLTAAGDETQAKKAKNALMYSIMGIIVALLGFVILQAATVMLNGFGGF
ncbi:MAG: hypothetical protein WCG84_01270 [Candidatus Moraniibacteriota bacterium]